MQGSEERSQKLPLYAAAVLALWAGVVAIRATGPVDLADNAQHRQAAYVADLFYNGAWLYQRDADGSFQSKPPLYNWLAGTVACCRGVLDELSLYAPCALAALLTAWATLIACMRAGLPPSVGLLAGIALIASPLGIKLVWLARTDTLFAALTWLTALAGFAALHGRSWLPFWLLAALATLTKGPLGLAFAAAGVIVYGYTERRTLHLSRSGMVLGFLVYAALTLGWFIAAVAVAGSGLAHKLLGQELVQHALFGVEHRVPFYRFYKPPLSFLARFFPWSLLAIAGTIRCVRLWPEVPRLVRFSAVYAGLGIALLMISPHHRADHLAPLLPGAAIVAAWRLHGLVSQRRWLLRAAAVGASVAAVAAAFAHYHLIRGKDPAVQRSLALKHTACTLRSLQPSVPVVPYRATGAFQFYLGTLVTDTSITPLLEALADGRPAVVVTTNRDALARELLCIDPSGWLCSLCQPVRLPGPSAPEVCVYVVGLHEQEALAVLALRQRVLR